MKEAAYHINTSDRLVRTWRLYAVSLFFFVFSLLLAVACASPASTPPLVVNPAFVSAGTDTGSTTSSASAKRRLLKYLLSQYGNHILSGQMDTAWDTNAQMDMISRVYNDTGKYPAIKGFDFIRVTSPWYQKGLADVHDQNGGAQGYNQTDEAIEWWNGQNNGTTLIDKNHHGIVAFCWHWCMPPSGLVHTDWNDNYAPDKTTFRIPLKADGTLDTDSEAGQLITHDLSLVAAELQKLKDLNIPVLWRPLHEASGGWFWWGASGAAAYKALWNYMYNYLVNIKGLDNLIWVWNGQSGDWIPDLSTVDIAGYDSYPSTARDYSSQKSLYTKVASWVNGLRMVTMSENGEIPDPVQMQADKASWLYFMTWNDADDGTPTDNFWSGDARNTAAHKQAVYNSEYVVTLDKLPNLMQN